MQCSYDRACTGLASENGLACTRQGMDTRIMEESELSQSLVTVSTEKMLQEKHVLQALSAELHGNGCESQKFFAE